MLDRGGCRSRARIVTAVRQKLYTMRMVPVFPAISQDRQIDLSSRSAVLRRMRNPTDRFKQFPNSKSLFFVYFRNPTTMSYRRSLYN